MIDLAASVAIVLGSVLMLLGALGVLRFPDVFTRMHAATKTASVGVIAITAAAVIEVGAIGGALLLLLVIALLFLSGPLGISLLARAAYHDAETPRAPQTTLHAPPAFDRPPAARVETGSAVSLAIWLWLVWIALFGSVRIPVVVGGALVAATIAFATRVLAPRWPQALRHPLAALRFAARLTMEMISASVDVGRAVLRDPARLRPAVVAVPLRASGRNELALLLNSVSFTPGTVALEIHEGALLVHVLDLEDPGELVESVRHLEALVIAAFGAGGDAPANDSVIT